MRTRFGHGLTVPAILVAALVFAGAAGARPGQKLRGTADSELASLSVALVAKGEALLAQKQLMAATDRFETALAVDPRNVAAYLGLAAVARAEGLPGKAARFYREALSIDPANVAALEGQGLAFIDRGARARAEANLERLRQICAAPCPAVNRLQSALAEPAPAMVEARARPAPAKP
ncbi:hypothetical protein [Thermaurantiacus sp.]